MDRVVAESGSMVGMTKKDGEELVNFEDGIACKL